jgi:hypothetical protein
MSPGQWKPNPIIARNPYAPGQSAGGGIAPAQANQPANVAQVPTVIGRWNSPQTGATLG